ncbi:MAG: DNA polymerase III subunit delta' [Candidatus Aureabacteria bacterium]|nr:DNA polymerase III subunit delta' [Candidatus Auribacterota bacterium]
MALREIKGQEMAVGLLKRSFAEGRLAHAYLFHGPEGVGKELTARNFAKLLNCGSPKGGDACDVCESCVRIQKGTHPDLLWLRPRGKARIIPIGEPQKPEKGTVRDFRTSVGMKPYMGKWKVGIFSDAHTLQRDAASALLKTLEEPPAHTIIVLITSRPEALLSTIVSRCQAVRFEAMPEASLEKILSSDYSLDAREAKLLSRLSGGRLGDAVRALRQERVRETSDLAGMLAEGERGYWRAVARPLELMERSLARAADSLEWEFAEKGLHHEDDGYENEEIQEQIEAFAVGETRRRQEELLGELLTWYRDLLVWRHTGTEGLLLSAGERDQVARAAQEMSVARTEQAIQRVEDALRSLRLNADFHTVVENLLVQIMASDKQ